jgi:hypothetical protein
MAVSDTRRSGESMVRVELGYCPRCGTLRAYLTGEAAEFCEACVQFLTWIRSGCERPRRRCPRRPDAPKGSRT